ncbi:putative glucooligosaccharide oxidase [Durotheca rogersii]|uniref:putative glucooligosaccharide oxidase n=1 Tax=Durotheca rogersii TaxID=419775 RepID=UPI00221EEAD4|nr:putative glucooligosaccharide oxidase [Durotheca rogersii]KAI5859928.1 putative glucooligosaccharide oxidase [Durotheca rogersii]
MTSTQADIITKQLADMEIPVKGAADSDWTVFSSTYNLRLPVVPAAVVLPRTVQHVSDAVLCAAQHGFKVQARSGGHSYASYSNGGVDGAVVVDLRYFQDVELISDSVVRVGGGVRVGNLACAIYDQSKRALAHGTCAAVGVGGHFTHGGYGLSSRAWGLAMDQIVAMDVVTADGRCQYVDNSKNPDLYYAMRGAADSFGIAVNFYLETQPAPESVTNWYIKICDATKSVENAVSALQHIQTYVHDESLIDRRLGLNVSLSSDFFGIGGTYFGSRADFEDAILPALLKGIPENPTIEVQQVDWLTSLKLLNQGQDLHVSDNYADHSNFFAKSAIVPEPGYTKDALASFFTHLLGEGARAPVSYFIMLDLYGGADSQINNKSAGSSAFAHRDALWVAQVYGYVGNDEPFPAEGLEFVDGLVQSMTRHLPEHRSYENYTDPSLTREQAHEQYRGRELYNELKSLKEKLDPGNVFANPQSI